MEPARERVDEMGVRVVAADVAEAGDESKVDELARELRLPLWRPARPALEVWVVVDDGRGRSVMPLELDYLRDVLVDVAHHLLHGEEALLDHARTVEPPCPESGQSFELLLLEGVVAPFEAEDRPVFLLAVEDDAVPGLPPDGA